jgi:hypothetical protein
MFSLGVPELLILLVLFGGFAVLVVGLVLLLSRSGRNTATNRRVEALEQEVKSLRQQGPSTSGDNVR